MHLNAEFQRIARREKKPFLSDQCKEIEANNRMGKTRDLLRKIRDTEGKFHAKMGTIKDRNGMDHLWTYSRDGMEDIKKRWKKYTVELYKKDLHDADNHNDHSPRARHPEMRSQVGLRKLHYQQSQWR